MTERRKSVCDGKVWYCRICKMTKSIRQQSFFSKSKLSLQKWLIAIYWWSREYPVIKLAEEIEITEDTACNLYQWLREVCSTKLISSPIILGGPGIVVQVDESQFKHKPKVIYYIIIIMFLKFFLCSIIEGDHL